MSIDQLISAAVSDRGASIDTPLRSLMEDCFQTSLRNVRLHFSPASQAANDALGSLAFAIDGNVCFRPGFDASLGTTFHYLLAHELTHVVQKRLGREQSLNPQSIAPEKQLELEASAAAYGALEGMRAPRLTPDPLSSHRMYGPAGHYYTAFYTAAATGFDYNTANAIAFYTQLPDLVDELDAKAQGMLWPKEFAKTYLPNIESHLSLRKSDREWWERIVNNHIDHMVLEWQVQAGLHSLTGGNAEAETDKRTKILNRYEPGTLEFGLAVHAFGDSFAHRDGDNMYGPPAGHAAEYINQALRGDFLSGEAIDPTDPDKINLRQDLYVNHYGENLYRLFLNKSPNKGKAPLDLTQYKNNLSVVASWESEEDQKRILASDTSEIYKLTIGYRPPDDTVPWEQFRLQRNHLHLSKDVLATALDCAAKWCGSAKPFHLSVHTNWKALKNNLWHRATTIDYGGNVGPLIPDLDY